MHAFPKENQQIWESSRPIWAAAGAAGSTGAGVIANLPRGLCGWLVLPWITFEPPEGLIRGVSGEKPSTGISVIFGAPSWNSEPYLEISGHFRPDFRPVGGPGRFFNYHHSIRVKNLQGVGSPGSYFEPPAKGAKYRNKKFPIEHVCFTQLAYTPPPILKNGLYSDPLGPTFPPRLGQIIVHYFQNWCNLYWNPAVFSRNRRTALICF